MNISEVTFSGYLITAFQIKSECLGILHPGQVARFLEFLRRGLSDCVLAFPAGRRGLVLRSSNNPRALLIYKLVLISGEQLELLN